MHRWGFAGSLDKGAHISLTHCRYPDTDVLERGIKVLMDKQLPNGDWPQVHLSSGLSKGFRGVADALGILQLLQCCAFPHLEGKPLLTFGRALQEGSELSTAFWTPHGALPLTALLSLSFSGEHCWGIQQVVCRELHVVPQRLPHLDAGAFLPAASPQPSGWAASTRPLGWGREECAGGSVCLNPGHCHALAVDLSYTPAAAGGHGCFLFGCLWHMVWTLDLSLLFSDGDCLTTF